MINWMKEAKKRQGKSSAASPGGLGGLGPMKKVEHIVLCEINILCQ